MKSVKNPIVPHTPAMYIVSISCRLPSKDTKDRLFLYMIYLSVIFAEEILILRVFNVIWRKRMKLILCLTSKESSLVVH